MSACPIKTGARPAKLSAKQCHYADYYADRCGQRGRYNLGLDAGANDYVTKPFRFGILLARMRAQLRSHEQAETAELHIGDYVFRFAG